MNANASRSRARQSNRGLLTRRNATSITGQFNSVRGDDGILRAFQSRPEFLHLGILDVHHNVQAFFTQPETFDLPGGRCYTPDALVRFRQGRRPVYREVKRLRDLEGDFDLEGRLDAIVAACDDRDADFEIVIEGYWLEPIRWSVTTHLRHAVRRATRLHMDLVRMELQDGALSIAEVVRRTSLGHDGKFAALSLVGRGEAVLRRDRPISGETLVRLA